LPDSSQHLLATFNGIFQIENDRVIKHSQKVTWVKAIAHIADNRYLVASGQLYLWNLDTDEIIQSIKPGNVCSIIPIR